MRRLFSAFRIAACESSRKRLGVGCAILALTVLAAPAPLRAQVPHVDAVATGQTEPGVSHEAAGPVEEEHAGRGIVDVVARVINFALLVGILAYFLRAPIRNYLSDRGTQIRSDLLNAKQTKEEAAAQIADIDRRMASLPRELDALRKQGAEDIATEEARIRAAAAAERDRLLEHARREIDLQVKIAERNLVEHAAELAVGVASERIKKNITDDDQKRLVDRYVSQLRG